jgi:hypothetical protein
MTLSFAIRFGASRARNDLKKNFRERLFLKCFKDRPHSVQVMCKVMQPMFTKPEISRATSTKMLHLTKPEFRGHQIYYVSPYAISHSKLQH